MITKDNFKSLLSALEFTSLSGKGKGIYIKQIGAFELRVDFNTETLIYPESDGMKINERQTCNMKANENFVVFECIHICFPKAITLLTLNLSRNGSWVAVQAEAVLIFSSRIMMKTLI